MPPSIVWDDLGNLIPVNPSPTDGTSSDQSEKFDEREPEIPEPPVTWHDVALSIAAGLMHTAKDEVRTKLGYTTSAVRIFNLPDLPFAILIVSAGNCTK